MEYQKGNIGTLIEAARRNQYNGSTGTKACDDAGKARNKTDNLAKIYINELPVWPTDLLFSQSSKDSPDAGFKPSGEEEKNDAKDPGNESEASGKDSEVPSTEEPREDQRVNQEKDASVNITNTINTVSLTVNTAGIEDNVVNENIVYGCDDDPNMPELEEIVYSDNDEDVGAEADINNLDAFMPVSPILTTRILKDHPICQQGSIHKAFIKLHVFAFSYSQEEPRNLPNGKRAIGTKWVYRNKKDERGIVIKNKARLVAQGYTQEEGIDYDELPELVYVDDIIFGSTKKSMCTEILKKFNAQRIPDEFPWESYILFRTTGEAINLRKSSISQKDKHGFEEWIIAVLAKFNSYWSAYLDGTDTKSEPFEDPVKTETPESPHTIAPPTTLPEGTPPTLVFILCRSARMAVYVPPEMSPGLSASMAEVEAMSDSAFRKRFRSFYESSPSLSPLDLPSQKCYRDTYKLIEDHEEEDDDEEEEEIEESLDSNSVSEDAEDEGPTVEDEDPAA
ncbi:putative ribonuclease H-like domain-containing protein [Tanacetum coccineum]